MLEYFQGFVNIYEGVRASLASLTFWGSISFLCWALSAILGAWMLYDWGVTDGRYSEAELTSSREGEIEAATEKHKL
jgi:hypothetical protein